MGVTNRLVFDPTDANSIAASSSVGAFVRAGTDGDLIGSETLNSVEWLRVTGPIIDSSGNEVGVTSNALDVNIAAGSVTINSEYAEDSAHSSTDTGQFALAIRVDDLTSVPVTALAGTELDYQGLIGADDGALFTASRTLDGAGAAIGSTGGSLDVNVTNASSIDLDDSLANTAIENTATAVSTTAVNVVTSALANRKWLYIANEGNKKGYFGKNGVSAVNGYPCHANERLEVRIGASVAPQLIGGTGASSEDYRIMELS